MKTLFSGKKGIVMERLGSDSQGKKRSYIRTKEGVQAVNGAIEFLRS